MSSRKHPIGVDDLVVLLLGAPTRASSRRGRIEGITRLEKLAFLVDQELKPSWLDEDPEFKAHNFGPFSDKIYRAVDQLSAYGLITDSEKASDTNEDLWEASNIIYGSEVDSFATRDFELTDRGWKYYGKLVQELPNEVEEELSSFKKRFSALPLRTLIRYVYERHEKFTTKSTIKDDILG